MESQYFELNGKLVGLRRRWYKGGGLFSEAEFANGVANGIVRQWSEAGVLTLYANTKDGELDGPYRSWWDNAMLKEEGVFAQGVRQPGFRWYREDGSLWREV